MTTSLKKMRIFCLFVGGNRSRKWSQMTEVGRRRGFSRKVTFFSIFAHFPGMSRIGQNVSKVHFPGPRKSPTWSPNDQFLDRSGPQIDPDRWPVWPLGTPRSATWRGRKCRFSGSLGTPPNPHNRPDLAPRRTNVYLTPLPHTLPILAGRGSIQNRARPIRFCHSTDNQSIYYGERMGRIDIFQEFQIDWIAGQSLIFRASNGKKCPHSPVFSRKHWGAREHFFALIFSHSGAHRLSILARKSCFRSNYWMFRASHFTNPHI